MFRFLKKRIIDWCLNKQDIQIGSLHNTLTPRQCEIYNENNELKFIEQSSPDDIFVETPSGYSKIKHTHKSIEYQVWKIQTTSHSLQCADTHIVITSDNQQVFVKDLLPGETIQTKTGNEQVISVKETDKIEKMYDIALDDEQHVYYTNDILSHNSVVSAAYLLWFAAFNESKTILIASRANSHAMEMVQRIRFAYEELPSWIKPGVLEDGWNKHGIGFDNGSRIISEATSENSGRGFSISLLYLDEFAFVKQNIQSEFWTSISPTLSTGGSCIMTSTPNGDSDIFAQIWRGANVGANSFYPVRVHWDEPPGRDEKFKEAEVGQIGEARWLQEYACSFLSSDALLIDSIFLASLTKQLKDITPKFVNKKGITFWDDIKQSETYLVGVDPATGSGEDFSVITIFHFPSLVQIGEYRENTMSTNDLYTVLKNLFLFMEKKNATVYFSVENNGVGEGVIALYQNDETFPENIDFVSEEGKDRLGITTTNKSKMKSCVSLKEMLEKHTLFIKSPTMLKELKAYTRRRGSYQAQLGSTDDCISAVLIMLRILDEMTTYDQDAFNKLYGGHYEEWGADAWDGWEGQYDEKDIGLPILV